MQHYFDGKELLQEIAEIRNLLPYHPVQEEDRRPLGNHLHRHQDFVSFLHEEDELAQPLLLIVLLKVCVFSGLQPKLLASFYD